MFLANLFLSTPIILVSMAVDLFSMADFLTRDESSFQFKYQQHEDSFGQIDLKIVMQNFGRIFYDRFDASFKNARYTLIELMNMHIKAYDLVENLHDLFCRGSKDYKEALQNIQIYNMTKVLTTKCSIPSNTGDIKQNLCDFDCIHAIQMDIEMYNYIHNVFRDSRSGKFKQGRSRNKDLDK